MICYRKHEREREREIVGTFSLEMIIIIDVKCLRNTNRFRYFRGLDQDFLIGTKFQILSVFAHFIKKIKDHKPDAIR